MNQITTSQLLYIQTGIGPKSVTQCHYQQYDISLPITINHTLIFLLELHQKSLPLQKKLAKRLLQINKKIPLFINETLILFPLKHHRAPIQIYVNAYYIIGIQSQSDATLIQFSNFKSLLVDEPYTFILKKWQESLLLCHLITHSYSAY
ncbi:competence transcription factor ComK [Staphylococcus warneri]|uniref:competence protein ComK n=1 Tax=unclassified Staphylococcus TaxID=91994 RepID=UPI000ED2F4E9|nr:MULTISPECIES: competence protein ComK [unclassified Staphylococcus]QSF52503.1 competence protein ComK [Staphylococcus sp. SB1-57]HBY83112.1 competence protein ComK [Staphylococcus sp.]